MCLRLKTISNIGKDKSFVYDLNKERGIVRMRVAFVPRSTEIKPLFWRFVKQINPPYAVDNLGDSGQKGGSLNNRLHCPSSACTYRSLGFNLRCRENSQGKVPMTRGTRQFVTGWGGGLL